MDNTTQWSILWSTALFPPQEMIPPDSIFCNTSHNYTSSTNSEHLFGFSPCIPTPPWESDVISSHEQEATDIAENDNFCIVDFSRLITEDEFVAFI